VPLPLSDAAAVDPEEAFIAALSSCHMLWFLAIAGKRKFRIDRYHDRASGVMAKNAAGKWWVSVVTLRPEVQFSGEPLPTRGEIEAMHESAHAECYIANSVSTQISIEPR
jgi:organic hydroperoxide reductase OsmC/OhrA